MVFHLCGLLHALSGPAPHGPRPAAPTLRLCPTTAARCCSACLPTAPPGLCPETSAQCCLSSTQRCLAFAQYRVLGLEDTPPDRRHAVLLGAASPAHTTNTFPGTTAKSLPGQRTIGTASPSQAGAPGARAALTLLRGREDAPAAPAHSQYRAPQYRL
jgi:hypothetical protein